MKSVTSPNITIIWRADTKIRNFTQHYFSSRANAAQNGCVGCVGNTVSASGFECAECGQGTVANNDNTACIDCPPGTVSVGRNCVCADGYYNSSGGNNILKCFSEGEPWVSLSLDVSLHCRDAFKRRTVKSCCCIESSGFHEATLALTCLSE